MKKFLEDVAEDLHKKLNGNFRNISIIFNNRRPSSYLQYYLTKSAAGKAIWAPQFHTIQTFFATLSQKKVASKTLQIFVLYREMQKILKNEGIHDRWPHVEEFSSIAETILSDFGQIQRELVSAEQIFQELREISEIDAQFSTLDENQVSFLKRFWGTFSQEKQQKKQEEFIKMWRRMPVLFQNFHQSLSEMELHTDGQIYAYIAQNLTEIHINPHSKWVFVGFNALTAAEIKAFSYWQEQGLAWFYFDSDAHFMEDERQEAGLFMRQNQQKYTLENQLDWCKNALATPKEINIYAAKGSTVQCTLLNDCLAKSVENNNSKIENTAIILLDENLLLPTLQHIPQNFTHTDEEIPVNISMGFSIKQNIIFNFLSNWIDLQKYYQSSTQTSAYQAPHLIVQSFLWNNFGGIQTPERNRILNEIIDKQYFYVPLSVLKTELFSNTDLYFEKADSGKHVISQLKSILEKAQSFLKQHQEIRKLEWETLLQLQKTLHEMEQELLQLNDLKLLDFKNLRVETVLELWSQAMSGIQITNEDFKMNALQIIGLLETRSLDFENLIFIGANEGSLPQTGNRPTFIPDSIRRAHQLPVSENLDAVSAYMFYRLIQRAKNVAIIYNSHTDENNSGEISRFVRQIEYELPYQFKYINPQYRLNTPKNSTIVIEKDASILAILDTYTHKNTLSPSAFTTYLNCSLQYFFQKIAKIEAPEILEEEIPSSSIGSILHHAMNELYRPFLQKSIQEKDFEQLYSEIEHCIHSAFNHVLFKNTDYQGKLTGKHLIVKEVVRQYIQIILEHDRKIAPIYLMGLEEYLTVKYPYIHEGKPRQILLNGFLDRVDMLDNPTKKVRIVDYKTGKDQLKFKNIAEMFFPTTDGNSQKIHVNKALIQTFIYTLMYESKNGFAHIEPNLYILREMKNQNTLFENSDTKKPLSVSEDVSYMQEFKKDFNNLFSKKIAEMFDPKIPYQQTPFEENCSYCAYKNICGR